MPSAPPSATTAAARRGRGYCRGTTGSVDARGREVLRFLPRNNDAVNEEWISDKTRYIPDGLKTQRLDRPYIRNNGRLEPASWDEAIALVGAKLKAAKPPRIAAI